ncbi:MAG: SUMF1/EgtB/PvdO family nonheme iron enzyme [Gemmataceae bacterium]|nr:SUMF1/EgtB/PvdO family nonheme iron enzyme [Gemmataceae bacterium]
MNKILAQADIALGQRLVELGLGDAELREQISALDAKTREGANTKKQAEALECRRSTLLRQLAISAQAQALPPAGAEEEFQKAKDARAAAQKQEDDTNAARKDLWPSGLSGWRRTCIGFGTVIGLIVCFIVFAFSGRPAPRIERIADNSTPTSASIQNRPDLAKSLAPLASSLKRSREQMESIRKSAQESEQSYVNRAKVLDKQAQNEIDRRIQDAKVRAAEKAERDKAAAKSKAGVLNAEAKWRSQPHVEDAEARPESTPKPKESGVTDNTAPTTTKATAPPIEGIAPSTHYTNGVGMKFVWIPPGSFLMGSPKEEELRSDDETQHKVTLTKGFYMGVYTVTQEQWQEVMGDNPSFFKGEKHLPVDDRSWDDCQEFIKKMRDKDKKAYRLPTEAEWEYACRAGTTTPFHFGETISTGQANYQGEFVYGRGMKGVFRNKTTPVGSFPANAWGLHDMHGNVWQWCQDWRGEYPRKNVTDPKGPENGEQRVLRGGSWMDIPGDCRSASRMWLRPGHRNTSSGLRVCFFLD